MSLQKIYLILLFTYSLVSCNKFEKYCPKVQLNEIGSLVDKNRLDSIQARVDLLVKNGFYDEAAKVDKLQDWYEFMNVYVEDTIAQKDIKLAAFSKSIKMIPKDNSILMINEAHHLVEHRLMALNNLKLWKSEGYKYIAIEAISSDQNIPIFKYGGVNPEIGFYTDEPYFSNILLLAKELGLELIRYEPLTAKYDVPGNRDSLMAINILKQWKPENGKLLIYCGWAHINNQKYWLRSYLEKSNSSLKIFSINQTYLNSSIGSKYQESLSKNLKNIDCPSILIRNGELYRLGKGYEMELIYPELPLKSDNCFPNLININELLKRLDKNVTYYFYNSEVDFDYLCEINPNLIVYNTSGNTDFYYLLPGKYNLFKYSTKNSSLNFIKSISL